MALLLAPAESLGVVEVVQCPPVPAAGSARLGCLKNLIPLMQENWLL